MSYIQLAYRRDDRCEYQASVVTGNIIIEASLLGLYSPLLKHHPLPPHDT